MSHSPEILRQWEDMAADCILAIEAHMGRTGQTVQDISQKSGKSVRYLKNVFLFPGNYEAKILLSVAAAAGLRITLVPYDAEMGQIYPGTLLNALTDKQLNNTKKVPR